MWTMGHLANLLISKGGPGWQGEGEDKTVSSSSSLRLFQWYLKQRPEESGTQVQHLTPAAAQGCPALLIC